MSTHDFSTLSLRLCGHCNDTQRHSNGHCKLCTRAEIKAWRVANPEAQKLIDAAAVVLHRAINTKDSAARYAANPDKQKAATAKWNSKNTEKVKAFHLDYRIKNKLDISKRQMLIKAKPENKVKAKAYHAAWLIANPDKARRIDQNYRAKKSESGGTLSRGLAERLLGLQKGKCACCGLPLGDNYHLDHIVPVSRGGPNIDSNIQLLRQRCNNQKGTKENLIFMQSRGFLL